MILIDVETCRRVIGKDRWLFITNCAVCWVKYYIFSLLHSVWIVLLTLVF